jgi:pyrroline-5-carboxylate reductase
VIERLGLIGYGSMGQMLLDGFLEAGLAAPSAVSVTTRTESRLLPLRERWPKIACVAEAAGLARRSDQIWVCVEPLEVFGVLKGLRDVLRPDHHLVSIAAGVSLGDIARACRTTWPLKVTKVIPSLTSEVGEGISLVCHNYAVSEGEARTVETLLAGIGTVRRVPESDFQAANLTSTAPGLIAALCQAFAEAGARRHGLDQDDAARLVAGTLYGTARLLHESGMDFGELTDRVATRGGITAAGVAVLEERLPAVFDEMLSRMGDRYARFHAAVQAQFRAEAAQESAMVTISAEDANGPDGLGLIRAMTAEMAARYPEDAREGNAGFDPAAVPMPGATFLIARRDGVPVGCGAVRPLADGIGEVKRMFIAPDVRRQGVSRQLLGALEDFARTFGYERLRLQTGIRQPEAIAMYEAAGYVRISCYGEYTDDPLSVCFEKTLTGQPQS